MRQTRKLTSKPIGVDLLLEKGGDAETNLGSIGRWIDGRGRVEYLYARWVFPDGLLTSTHNGSVVMNIIGS